MNLFCLSNFTIYHIWPQNNNLPVNIRSNPISFRQGSDNIPLTSFDNIVKTEIFGSPGSFSFGLHWNDLKSSGIFPEYYRQEGQNMAPISASDIPDETELILQTFQPANVGKSYTSPQKSRDSWDRPGPRQGPFKVLLTDNSEVTYSWYRFIDQPTLQKLGWSEKEKKRLQSLVENIHAEWPITRNYMPGPSLKIFIQLF